MFIDNAKEDKSINIIAQAGSVEVTKEYISPDIGSDLTIAELVLEEVPAGTDSLDFIIQSPSNGDAALLSGLVVSYPCLARATSSVATDNVDTHSMFLPMVTR